MLAAVAADLLLRARHLDLVALAVVVLETAATVQQTRAVAVAVDWLAQHLVLVVLVLLLLPTLTLTQIWQQLAVVCLTR
jgi:hypothetical protein